MASSATTDQEATMNNGKRKVVIEPITRVEGHGKVTLLLDEQGVLERARFHIVEFRGFERYVQGRPYWEMPVLVQRLCGICPVSHHLAAAKALDAVLGIDELTATGEKMRRLMHYGQTFQSHALHFFHLVSPDLLFGFDAEPALRNVVAVAKDPRFAELAVRGVLMRKYGQEIIQATAGKKIHGTGAIPGGINRHLDPERKAHFLADVDKMIAWSQETLELCRGYTLDNLERLAGFGTVPMSSMSIVRPDGTLDLYDGNLRALDAEGNTIFDQVTPAEYNDVLAEEVRPWSYMKFPFIKALGPEKGWYRVGPLARLNCCDRIDTPLAEAARQQFREELGGGGQVQAAMAYHWARIIELLHSAEKIKELLDDPDLLSGERVAGGQRRGEGVGIIEAPRGTLIHHYRVADDDTIAMANLIVSTTHNNEPMNRSVAKVAQDDISGQEITEGLLNHIEVAIRAYDPCLSCATHAVGRMPLEVSLLDAEGRLIDRKAT
jgi:NAD-reducing hydrogenase large subunit